MFVLYCKINCVHACNPIIYNMIRRAGTNQQDVLRSSSAQSFHESFSHFHGDTDGDLSYAQSAHEAAVFENN